MDTTNPQNPLDQVLPEEIIAHKAEEIAKSKVEELKSDLITSLSGQKNNPDEPPKSWSSLREEMAAAKKEAVEIAKKEVMSTIEAERKANEERLKAQEQMTVKEKQAQVEKEWTDIRNQWEDAVNDGLLPKIDEKVASKLKSGVVYSDLTPEEQKDPGLKAWQDTYQLHLKMRQEGKSSSFYRTVQKFYNQEPAGKDAPVFGKSTQVNTGRTKGEYSYADVVANRKKHFGW